MAAATLVFGRVVLPFADDTDESLARVKSYVEASMINDWDGAQGHDDIFCTNIPGAVRRLYTILRQYTVYVLNGDYPEDKPLKLHRDKFEDIPIRTTAALTMGGRPAEFLASLCWAANIPCTLGLLRIDLNAADGGGDVTARLQMAFSDVSDDARYGDIVLLYVALVREDEDGLAVSRDGYTKRLIADVKAYATRARLELCAAMLRVSRVDADGMLHRHVVAALPCGTTATAPWGGVTRRKWAICDTNRPRCYPGLDAGLRELEHGAGYDSIDGIVFMIRSWQDEAI